MKNLVVSFASGGYLKGQERLRRSCGTIGQPILCYAPGNGFTPHAEVPYYFKVDALRRASQVCRLLLWLDASIVATGRPLDPIFDHVEREGYLLTHQGWNNAQWCSDRSLASFGFTRDEAVSQKQIRGGFLGLNLDHPLGEVLLDEAERHRDDFRGRWDNKEKTESTDPRCLGHRHDQSVFSLVAAKHGLEIRCHDADPWCCYDRNPKYLLNILGNPQ